MEQPYIPIQFWHDQSRIILFTPFIGGQGQHIEQKIHLDFSFETLLVKDPIQKPIDNNTECPITYEPIQYGDQYFQCKTCKYNFSTALLNKKNNISCPMCRSDFQCLVKYINKTPEDTISSSASDTQNS